MTEWLNWTEVEKSCSIQCEKWKKWGSSKKLEGKWKHCLEYKIWKYHLMHRSINRQSPHSFDHALIFHVSALQRKNKPTGEQEYLFPWQLYFLPVFPLTVCLYEAKLCKPAVWDSLCGGLVGWYQALRLQRTATRLQWTDQDNECHPLGTLAEAADLPEGVTHCIATQRSLVLILHGGFLKIELEVILSSVSFQEQRPCLIRPHVFRM